MDGFLLLSGLRVALCLCVIAVIVLLAARRRIEWWKVGWLLLYLGNQMAFSIYVLMASSANTLDVALVRVWSTLLDIHSSFATLAYLFVVSRSTASQTGGSRNSHDERTGVVGERPSVFADNRDDSHQHRIAVEKEREWTQERGWQWEWIWACEWEWLSGCRRREDQQSVARVDARAAARN